MAQNLAVAPEATIAAFSPADNAVGESVVVAAVTAGAAASAETIDADISEHQPQKQLMLQPLRSDLSPKILNRKSLIMKSVPRVPSTLRKVVDVSSPDPRDNVEDEVYAHSGQRPTTVYSSNSSTHSGSNGVWMHSPDTPPLPAIPASMSSPALRRYHDEPSLLNMIDRPANNVKCLPYPHTLDSYIPRPRPRSLNTVNSTSCRLSIITTNVEYTEYSHQKKAHVVVRPSRVRGWARRFGGRVKFTVGQILASPTLILRGNRDMARGTAQISLWECKKAAESQNAAAPAEAATTDNAGLGIQMPRRNSSTTDSSGGSSGGSLRAIRRKSMASTNNSIKALSPQVQPKQSVRSLSVIQMAAAAEHAAELELAEVTVSLMSARTSTRSRTTAKPHQRSSSGSDTTDVEADGTTTSPSDTKSRSPLTGPTRTGSIENISRSDQFKLALDTSTFGTATSEKISAGSSTDEVADVKSVQLAAPQPAAVIS
ncbi:hypothetical protein LPJ53_001690 [Coemansia erecta]|uniref:Uncharacterized protein n=1 Tax=Coemansia erecta TaxID=147472 RepID=A0A9W7Y3H2_9FUNG|nr:hypothetical protein LPJ53_001690 [Coemansia erecta]